MILIDSRGLNDTEEPDDYGIMQDLYSYFMD